MERAAGGELKEEVATMKVLGLDCGLANLGWALAELLAESERPLALGNWCTEASDEKTVAGADDMVRRGLLLARELERFVDHHQPSVICAERFSVVVVPRFGKGKGKFAGGTTDEGGVTVSAKSTAQLAFSWGLVTAIAQARSIPIRTCTPQGIKAALTGRANAKKGEVQDALERRYGPLLFAGVRRKGDREHAGDALGAIVALLDSDVVQLGRRQAVEASQRRRAELEPNTPGLIA